MKRAYSWDSEHIATIKTLSATLPTLSSTGPSTEPREKEDPPHYALFQNNTFSLACGVPWSPVAYMYLVDIYPKLHHLPALRGF